MNNMIEPEEINTRTIKVDCYFTTYVQVNVSNCKSIDDEREYIEQQLDSLDMDELLDECDKINIDNWEEV